MVSEITEVVEDEEEKAIFTIETEAQKNKIREIIKYQKSLYSLSSSPSSTSSQSASCSSFSSSRKSNSLLDLMKEGSTSLKRLFDMEHTSLSKHFNEYSGSPIIKPILLWGSDIEDGIYEDPWRSIKRSGFGSGGDSIFSFGKNKNSFLDGKMSRKPKLIRTRSFHRLPEFGLWLFRGFRLRFRLRRLRIMICGRKY